MNAINAILTAVFDAIFAVLGVFPPAVTLIILSAVAGLLMTVVFRYTSNQKALRAVADRTRADLLALKLFKDDLGVALRAQWGLLKSTGLRLWYSLPPLAVLIVPFVLALAQLGLRYEYRALPVGVAAAVELQLSAGAWEAHQNVQLQAPEGVVVETPGVRAAHDHTITWRIRPTESGTFALGWTIGDERVEKLLAVDGNPQAGRAISVLRPGPSFWDRLLYPAEPGFGADSPVQAIELHYDPPVERRASTPILGFDIHWLITFFVASVLCALLVRPLLRVQF